MQSSDKLRITLKDKFIEFDDGNGLLLCDDIYVVNVSFTYFGNRSQWVLKVYSSAHDAFPFVFSNKDRAEECARMIRDAHVDLMKMKSGLKSGVKTDTITEVRECPK